jgi:hypothetical protein
MFRTIITVSTCDLVPFLWKGMRFMFVSVIEVGHIFQILLAAIINL